MSPIPACFEKSEASRKAYSELASFLGNLRDVVTEPKQTCAHFVAGGGAFLGAHPRREGIRINIVLSRMLSGDRIVKSEQVSKRRFHNEVDLAGDAQIDHELADWIREAYNLRMVQV
ncbi:MAG TPA: DUF5655 domain-containing protein [Fimbriimonadales bacterium]|jgi:hypothetical protein|nr:DUF5655 domain-containing protein [Fimbriimonadales bacterium]